ncbi:peroxiredoxin [Demequina aurantiaca]|uniref:peroxiredoxin n=1 Tax=Demequina aurantiaca TaxID=676200 RepID=UPI003D34B0AB
MTPTSLSTPEQVAEARDMNAEAQPLIGSPAPDFSLLDQHGRTVTLKSFRGGGVLLIFVPFAFTDTCTNELVELQGATDLLGHDDITVTVVSCDSIYTLKAWADAHSYAGGILSDFWPHGQAARAYGVFNEDKGLANRGSFLIDGDGIVRWAVVSPIGRPRDLDAYRAALPLAVRGG